MPKTGQRAPSSTSTSFFDIMQDHQSVLQWNALQSIHTSYHYKNQPSLYYQPSPREAMSNRYSKLHIFNHSRVIYNDNNNDDNDSEAFYLNANWITTYRRRSSFENDLQETQRVCADHQDTIYQQIQKQYPQLNIQTATKYDRYPFIIGEAPTYFALNNFFHLLQTHQIKQIVCLTPLTENGKEKATSYWPACLQTTIHMGHWSVTLLNETQHYQGALIVRTLEIKRTLNNMKSPFEPVEHIMMMHSQNTNHNTSYGPIINNSTTHHNNDNGINDNNDDDENIARWYQPFQVKHYQYVEWNDHHVPSDINTLMNVVKLIQNDTQQFMDHAVYGTDQETSARPRLLSINQKHLLHPMFVHCSAGIGRSGAFVAIFNLLLIHSRDVFGMVNWLRTQRAGVVQNYAQYALIHQVVRLWHQQLKARYPNYKKNLLIRRNSSDVCDRPLCNAASSPKTSDTSMSPTIASSTPSSSSLSCPKYIVESKRLTLGRQLVQPINPTLSMNSITDNHPIHDSSNLSKTSLPSHRRFVMITAKYE